MTRSLVIGAGRCPSKVLILDDRWGGFEDMCDLEADHTGDHRSARNACMPKAYLGWSDLDVQEGQP